mgnify:CR=1 FL=1
MTSKMRKPAGNSVKTSILNVLNLKNNQLTLKNRKFRIAKTLQILKKMRQKSTIFSQLVLYYKM